MDAVTPPEETPGRRLRIAAFNSGIGPGEPLEPIIEELAKFADDLPKFAKQVGAEIKEAKSPFAQADIDRVVAEVADKTNKWHEKHLVERVWAKFWANWTRLAAVGAAAMIVCTALGFGGGYWFAWHDASLVMRDVPMINQEMRAIDAGRWANLLRYNWFYDMDKTCVADKENGRAVCQYRFWDRTPEGCC